MKNFVLLTKTGCCKLHGGPHQLLKSEFSVNQQKTYGFLMRDVEEV